MGKRAGSPRSWLCWMRRRSSPALMRGNSVRKCCRMIPSCCSSTSSGQVKHVLSCAQISNYYSKCTNDFVISSHPFLSDQMNLNASKLVFQGGLLFLPIKNGAPRRIHFKSGMYVTANAVSTNFLDTCPIVLISIMTKHRYSHNEAHPHPHSHPQPTHKHSLFH